MPGPASWQTQSSWHPWIRSRPGCTQPLPRPQHSKQQRPSARGARAKQAPPLTHPLLHQHKLTCRLLSRWSRSATQKQASWLLLVRQGRPEAAWPSCASAALRSGPGSASADGRPASSGSAPCQPARHARPPSRCRHCIRQPCWLQAQLQAQLQATFLCWACGAAQLCRHWHCTLFPSTALTNNCIARATCSSGTPPWGRTPAQHVCRCCTAHRPLTVACSPPSA